MYNIELQCDELVDTAEEDSDELSYDSVVGGIS